MLGSRVLGFTQELFDDSAQPGGNAAELELMARQMALHYPHIAEIAAAASHEDESVVGRGCDDQFEFEFGSTSSSTASSASAIRAGRPSAAACAPPHPRLLSREFEHYLAVGRPLVVLC